MQAHCLPTLLAIHDAKADMAALDQLVGTCDPYIACKHRLYCSWLRSQPSSYAPLRSMQSAKAAA
jgi:hypothetical protein